MEEEPEALLNLRGLCCPGSARLHGQDAAEPGRDGAGVQDGEGPVLLHPAWEVAAQFG